MSVRFSNITSLMIKNHFLHNVDNMQVSFNVIGRLSIRSFLLEKLMVILKPFINILDMITPVFELVGGMIEAFFLPLMEAITPVIKKITEYMKFVFDLAKKTGIIIYWGISVAFQFLWIFVLQPIYLLFKTGFYLLWETIITVLRIIANALIFFWNAVVTIWNWMIDAVNWFTRYILFGWLWGYKDIAHVEYADYVDPVDQDRWSSIFSTIQEDWNNLNQQKQELLERIAEGLQRGLL